MNKQYSFFHRLLKLDYTSGGRTQWSWWLRSIVIATVFGITVVMAYANIDRIPVRVAITESTLIIQSDEGTVSCLFFDNE